MRRKYIHPEGEIHDGKLYCTECGALLNDDLSADECCTVSTTSLAQIGGLCWFINVWNCKAELTALDASGEYHVAECDPELEEEVRRLVEDAVDKQGAINWSGWYAVPDELCDMIAAGKIRPKEM